jgi:hypothetical protein
MRIGIRCVLLASSLISAMAQVPSAIPSEPPQLLTPNQLDNLVAPVALYPDQLLGQVLAASTYPLEIVEAQQFLQRNGNLQGAQLLNAAKQQNWDPSVQALVAFPDAVALLTRDIQWTTALGNAFLAQQADVMNAIQQMRARAQNKGRLVNTPQQTVTAQYQDGQNAIQIQPANPQVMYVPSYSPQYVWGPPAEGYYPQLGDSYGDSGGFGFGQAVNIASYLAGFAGLLGWGGWGWGLNWLAHSLFLNGLFFNLFGFHGGGSYGGGVYHDGYGARSAWVHDPGHRLGVPYSNRAIANRFGGSFRPVSAGFAAHRGFEGGWRTPQRSAGQSFAGRIQESGGGWHSSSGGRPFASNFGSNFGPNSGSNRGFSGFLEPRQASQNFGAQHLSAPKVSTSHFSAPRTSAPKFSAPKSSGGHFSGGSHFSGGHGSGGHSSGGHGGGGHGGSHRH